MPNNVFPGARTIVPIAISPDPPPDVPGSFVFSDHFENWYTDHVIDPGQVRRRDIRRYLNDIWAAQRKVQEFLNEVP